MKPRDLDPDDDAELPASEAARDRRRDHDLRSEDRVGMRTGLAKQFKQVLDAQAKRGREAAGEALADERDEPTLEGTRRSGRSRDPIRPAESRRAR